MSHCEEKKEENEDNMAATKKRNIFVTSFQLHKELKNRKEKEEEAKNEVRNKAGNEQREIYKNTMFQECCWEHKEDKE